MAVLPPFNHFQVFYREHTDSFAKRDAFISQEFRADLWLSVPTYEQAMHICDLLTADSLIDHGDGSRDYRHYYVKDM